MHRMEAFFVEGDSSEMTLRKQPIALKAGVAVDEKPFGSLFKFDWTRALVFRTGGLRFGEARLLLGAAAENSRAATVATRKGVQGRWHSAAAALIDAATGRERETRKKS